jgi:hypothetical protein
MTQGCASFSASSTGALSHMTRNALPNFLGSRTLRSESPFAFTGCKIRAMFIYGRGFVMGYWRPAYVKRDGTRVRGHWVRTANRGKSTPSPPPPPTIPAPPPAQVSGHTESRPRKKRRKSPIAITVTAAIAAGTMRLIQNPRPRAVGRALTCGNFTQAPSSE